MRRLFPRRVLFLPWYFIICIMLNMYVLVSSSLSLISTTIEPATTRCISCCSRHSRKNERYSWSDSLKSWRFRQNPLNRHFSAEKFNHGGRRRMHFHLIAQESSRRYLPRASAGNQQCIVQTKSLFLSLVIHKRPSEKYIDGD